MSSTPPGHRGDEGFTLIELLVTLAVLSCISTVMLSAIVTVRHVAQRLIADESEEAQIAVAQTILRSRIERLRALPRSDRASPVVDLQGDEQRFSFYAPPVERDAPTSLQAFRLLRMATGDLVLFSSPSLAEDIDLRSPSIAGWTPLTLLKGADAVSISYFGPGPGRAGASWQRFWSNRAQPPQLVRIGVRFAEGDRRSWPDLVIRPGVTMNMECKFDTVTSRCSNVVGQ